MNWTTNYTCFNCFSGTDGVDPCPHCGFENSAHIPKPHVLAPGTVLHEGYLIGRELGQGGFGITYLGYDLASKQRVAIKEFYPAGMVVRQNNLVQPTTQENQAVFKRGVEAFNKEARILSQLGKAPNIVDIHTFFFENGTGYFVMEFLDGQSLKDLLTARGGWLPFQEAMNILLPIMHAVESIHREGMLHRDIAPDNITITTDGVPKLMDFGAARFHSFQETQSVRTIVKPGYAPMEQYASQSAQGPWTDVYAMGATIYRTLTGIIPPDAPSRAMKDELKSPLQSGCLMSLNADQAIMRALSMQIMFRYRSMADFEQALLTPDSTRRISALPPNPVMTPAALIPQNAEPVTQRYNPVSLPFSTPSSSPSQEKEQRWTQWFFPAVIILLLLVIVWLSIIIMQGQAR